MSVIQAKAEQISADMASDGKIRAAALDPMVVQVIVQVVIEAAKMLYQCYQDHHKAAKVMQSPGLVERWRLRRLIRTGIDDAEMQAAIGGRMFDSFLKVAAGVTEEEVVQLVKEAE